jgi:putative component of membrane protein insertase Oxa1/YidC/SpoIIIJ protein YidD
MKGIAGWLLCIIMVLISNAMQAQLSEKDFLVLSSHEYYSKNEFQYYQGPGNNQSILTNKNKGVLSKFNPVSLLAKGMMWTYQNAISPQLSKSCPYEITCSNYAKASINKFGMIKGIFMAGDRLMRCNRISLMDISSVKIDEHLHAIIDSPDNYKWQNY